MSKIKIKIESIEWNIKLSGVEIEIGESEIPVITLDNEPIDQE